MTEIPKPATAVPPKVEARDVLNAVNQLSLKIDTLSGKIDDYHNDNAVVQTAFRRILQRLSIGLHRLTR